MKSIPTLALALAALAASSCTLVAIDSSSSPTGLQMSGLVNGHVAFGMADEHGLFEAELFDGPNSGSLAHIRLANLLAVDVGAVGAALTIGPLHLGLGTLFYEPYPPYIPSDDADDETDDEDLDEDEG